MERTMQPMSRGHAASHDRARWRHALLACGMVFTALLGAGLLTSPTLRPQVALLGAGLLTPPTARPALLGAGLLTPPTPRPALLGAGLLTPLTPRPQVSPEPTRQPKVDGTLARYVPRQHLACYLEFDGLNAHAAAWRASAAYKLLNETKLGALLEDLGTQAIELLQQSTPLDKRVACADAVEAFKHVMRAGFAVAVVGDVTSDRKVILVLRRGDRPEVRRVAESLAPARSAAAAAHGAKDKQDPDGSSETDAHFLAGASVWWVEKGDLVLAHKSIVHDIEAVLAGKQPSAVDHPLRVELAKAGDVFQPAAIGFFDMAALRLPEQAAQLGLDGLKRFELRFAFQDDALVTELKVVAPEPRRGLLTLFDQAPFAIDSLPPLPAGTTGFTAFALDPAMVYDQVNNLLSVTGLKSQVGTGLPLVLADRGFELRRDLCARLGPKFAFYAQAPAKEDTETVAAMWVNQLAGWTFSAQVRDEQAVAGAIDPLIVVVNQTIKRQLQLLQRRRLVNPGWTVEVRKLAERRGYKLKYVNSPPQLLSKLQPTMIVGRDQLVVAATPAAAERALAAGARWQPAGEFLPVIKRLPAQMSYLSLQDPRVWSPLLVDMLPIAVRQINSEIALAQARVGKTPDGTSMRLDADMVPAAADLNRLLFPSSTAVVVDREGARLVQRESLFSPTSPVSLGALAVLSLPAIESALDSVRRAQCAENLQRIALAMHRHHATNNSFPRPAITDAAGKPLLSWRVAILPFLDQKALYDKFKLDEPWDSAANQALLKEMPAVYQCPDRSKGEPFTTTYRVLVGKGALFEKDKDRGSAVGDITDGTSNTIMVVESAAAVPWTKPDELPFDLAAVPSLQGAGSPHPGGFQASFADGSTHFIKNTVDLNTFRSLITRAGGEVINPGTY